MKTINFVTFETIKRLVRYILHLSFIMKAIFQLIHLHVCVCTRICWPIIWPLLSIHHDCAYTCWPTCIIYQATACLFTMCRVTYSFSGPTIVYCRKKQITEETARMLQSKLCPILCCVLSVRSTSSQVLSAKENTMQWNPALWTPLKYGRPL